MTTRNIEALTAEPGGIWPRTTIGAALVGMSPTFGLAVAWIIWWAL